MGKLFLREIMQIYIRQQVDMNSRYITCWFHHAWNKDDNDAAPVRCSVLPSNRPQNKANYGWRVGSSQTKFATISYYADSS